MTEDKAYDNWQNAIMLANRVEVACAQVYQHVHYGLPYTPTMREKLYEHAQALRALLDVVEREVETLPDCVR